MSSNYAYPYYRNFYAYRNGWASKKKTTPVYAKKISTRVWHPRLASKMASKTLPSSAEVRKMVKAEIHRQAENKTIQTISAIYVPTTTNDSAGVQINNAIIRLTPSATLSYQISQGDGQGQRTGNSITTRKMQIRGVLTAEPYESTNNPSPVPVVVKMLLMYDKRCPTGIDPSNNNEVNPTPQSPNNDFFQLGSTVDGFLGSNLDQMQTYNRDRYAVLEERTYKIGYQRYDGLGSGTPTSAQQYYANNDFSVHVPVEWDVTKYMPKTIKFNDTSTSPNTRALFLMSFAVPATGVVVTAPTPSPQVLFRFTTDYEYEDV